MAGKQTQYVVKVSSGTLDKSLVVDITAQVPVNGTVVPTHETMTWERLVSRAATSLKTDGRNQMHNKDHAKMLTNGVYEQGVGKKDVSEITAAAEERGRQSERARIIARRDELMKEKKMSFEDATNAALMGE